MLIISIYFETIKNLNYLIFLLCSLFLFLVFLAQIMRKYFIFPRCSSCTCPSYSAGPRTPCCLLRGYWAMNRWVGGQTDTLSYQPLYLDNIHTDGCYTSAVCQGRDIIIFIFFNNFETAFETI